MCARIAARDPGRRTAGGFSLLELTIVATILSTIGGIALPQYASALRTARVGKARHELATLSRAIDGYALNNGGQLPLTLHQVGFGGRRDPWGIPYCYFNYQSGSGDGLDWAVDAGLVDPSAVVDSSGGSDADGDSTGSGGPVPRRIGVPASVPRIQGGVGVETARGHGGLAHAYARARTAASRIVAGVASVGVTPRVDADTLAVSLAAAPTFHVFVGVDAQTTRRRDGFMFPLNSDYDLFSLGPDGRTAVSLGQPMARDDVIRANNGGFFGTASEY